MVNAAQEMARPAGVEMATYRMGVDVQDVEGRWPEKYGVTDTGAVLVRPDGIVAWRASGTSDTPARALSAALAQVLGAVQPH
jgi:putative polyketide hydroxylase